MIFRPHTSLDSKVVLVLYREYEYVLLSYSVMNIMGKFITWRGNSTLQISRAQKTDVAQIAMGKPTSRGKGGSLS